MDHTPLNRFGNANELVGAAVFLSSTMASGFVTGTDLRVDGDSCQTRYNSDLIFAECLAKVLGFLTFKAYQNPFYR